jgi:hypothetical protein
MNEDAKPEAVFDLIVARGDGTDETIEIGLSRGQAEAAKVAAAALFQGVRIVERRRKVEGVDPDEKLS